MMPGPTQTDAYSYYIRHTRARVTVISRISVSLRQTAVAGGLN
jgi:hypothetical protein